MYEVDISTSLVDRNFEDIFQTHLVQQHHHVLLFADSRHLSGIERQHHQNTFISVDPWAVSLRQKCLIRMEWAFRPPRLPIASSIAGDPSLTRSYRKLGLISSRLLS